MQTAAGELGFGRFGHSESTLGRGLTIGIISCEQAGERGTFKGPGK